jgi:hypothetical protein
VPGTLIAKNLMLAYKWGLKTIYYSLVNKLGAKAPGTGTNTSPLISATPIAIYEDQEDCEACKL